MDFQALNARHSQVVTHLCRSLAISVINSPVLQLTKPADSELKLLVTLTFKGSSLTKETKYTERYLNAFGFQALHLWLLL